MGGDVYTQVGDTWETNYQDSSGGGFDWGGFANGTVDSLGGILGGIGVIIGASKGNPVTVNNQTGNAQQPTSGGNTPPTKPSSSNIFLWVLLIVFLLLVVAGSVYLITRKKAA